MNRLRTASSLALAAAFAAALEAGAPQNGQQQAPAGRAGWPCGARLDASYFGLAEGTGGHLLLLAPEEIADSTALLMAFDQHPQTISRTAGTIQRGLREFSVPIDSSVESVLFSMSVQCLQRAEVVRPSGGPAIGDDVTDLSNFRAERMVIVRRPQPGTWTMRVEGSGVGGIVVQARTSTAISQVEFATPPNERFTAVPSAGVENTLRLRIRGVTSEVHGALVDGTSRHLADLALEAGDGEGLFVARVNPGTTPFRVLVTGQDAEGRAFQRMSAPLLTPAR